MTARLGRTGPIVDKLQSMPLAKPEDRLAIATLVAKLKPDVIAAVVPAAKTSLRLLDIAAPTGRPDEVAGAMRLLIESHLPGTYPAHRRAGCILGAGEQARPLIVGWTGQSDDLGLPRVDVWVPEMAVLILAAASPSGDSSADRAAAVITQQTGTGALIDLRGAPRVRSTVLAPPGDSACFDRAGVLGDLAGLDELYEPVSGSKALLPRAGIASTARRSTEEANQYALAVLAAQLVAGGSAASPPLATGLADLLTMTDQPAEARVSPFVRLLTTLGRQRVAVVATAACLGLLACSPLAFAALRLRTLSAAQASLPGGDDGVTKAADQLDLYDTLSKARWPMTRLLSELSSAAPQGLYIDTVNIEHGKRIALTGQFSDSQQVTDFRENLAKSKVLEDLKFPQTVSTSQRFQFNAMVSPNVVLALGGKSRPASASATSGAKSDTKSAASNDTKAETKADPKTDTAGGRSTPVPASGTRANTNNNRNNGASGTGGNGGTNNRTTRGGNNTTPAPAGSGGNTPAPAETKAAAKLPEPISDQQISGLDNVKAMLEWATRRAASQRPDIDEATRNRLTDEVTKLTAHREALKNSGGAK